MFLLDQHCLRATESIKKEVQSYARALVVMPGYSSGEKKPEETATSKLNNRHLTNFQQDYTAHKTRVTLDET